MKTTLKDLLRHKFPMDESEQAILLNEISELEKQLHEYLKLAHKYASGTHVEKLIKEILG